MAVVGAWAEGDALRVARELLPTGAHWTEDHSGALVSTDELGGCWTVVGTPPTTSRMGLSREGLVLERGAAWTAPIYYRKDARVACTDLRLLVREGDEPDVGHLSAPLVCMNRYDDNRTPYRSISVVRPFERVVLSRERTAARFPFPRLERIETRDLDALAMELRRRLLTAVDRAAGSRRVAVMLSGGVDSSSVLAALVAVRGGRAADLGAATIDFDAPGSDRPHVRALERHFGICPARISPSDASFREALVVDGAPTRHAGDGWLLACARRTHSMGAELLLTGVGGDQLYGGSMEAAIADGIRHRDPVGVLDAVRARFPHRLSLRLRARLAVVAVARPWAPPFVRRWRARHNVRGIPDWAGPMLRAEMTAEACERAQRSPPRNARERYEELLTRPYEHGLAVIRAQMGTVAPIPPVDPLYDDDLVRYLASVPHQTLFADGSHRGLLRRAIRDLLPESVRMRNDKSRFEAALAQAFWPIDDLRDLLTFSALGEAGIVRADRFRHWIAPLLETPSHTDNGLRWTSFVPALALEKHLRTRP